MKHLIVAAFILLNTAAIAQSGFGIKGGLNYGATGEYENFSEVVGDASTIENGNSRAGYHLGIFGKIGAFGIFIQPELLYTRLNTEYSHFTYSIDKLDAPVLVGVNLLGPLNIKAGPSFQYILNNNIDGSTLQVTEMDNEITIGYQLGAGINLGRLGFDLRYEGAFGENNAFGNRASDHNFTIDSRPSQWILSLSYNLR